MKSTLDKHIIKVFNGLNIKHLLILTIILQLFFINIYSQQKKKLILQSINFNGNSVFTGSVLKNVIVSRESPSWLSRFFHSFSPLGVAAVPFDSTLIKSDISSLENYYKVNGYFDVKINYSYYVDTSNSEVELDYSIFEGKPYHFKKITKKGLKRVPSKFVKATNTEYNLDSTKIFTEKKVLNDLAFTTAYFRNRGYMLFSNARPDIYVDTTMKTISVKVKFNW